MSFARGSVWYAEIPRVGDKPVVIVSSEFVNQALANVVTARIASVERERALPTFVALRPSEVGDLPERSFIICHDLLTFPKNLFRRYIGALPAPRLLEVEAALRRALDL